MSALYHWSPAAFQSEGRFRATLTVRFPYHHHRLLLTLGPAEGRRAAYVQLPQQVGGKFSVLFQLFHSGVAR